MSNEVEELSRKIKFYNGNFHMIGISLAEYLTQEGYTRSKQTEVLKHLKEVDVQIYADNWRLGPKDEATYNITQEVRFSLNSRLTSLVEGICHRYGTPSAPKENDR